MTSYVLRLGQMIEADGAFFAWTSGDLSRMLRALPVPTNLIDRHFLLQNIVALTYKDRDNREARRLCMEIGLRHVAEFDRIAPALRQDMSGTLPRVTTFPHLATLLAEDGQFERAVAICERAQLLGLHDGTKGDFAGRIARIRKMAAGSVSA